MSKIEHIDAWKAIVAFVRQYNCSDLTFNRQNVSGRVDNAIVRLSEDNVFTREAFAELLHSILDSRPDLKSKLLNGMPSLDLSVVKGGMRFRVNIVRSQGELTASLRPLPENPPSLKDIGIKETVAKTVLGYQSGLLVVAGPTGSGKTTTVAAFLRAINETQPVKVITIEDPIEYELPNLQAEIIQREVGTDCRDFATGARDAMRQTPDVIFVGEIRDGETAKAAFYAAETGHRVYCTLHSESVVEIPARLVHLLPPEDKTLGRYLLSRVTRAFISQRLLRLRDGGRCALREILLFTNALRPLIEKENEHEFPHLMRSNQSLGMIDLQTDLSRLRSKLAPGEFDRFRQE